jgi:hypothetical protein
MRRIRLIVAVVTTMVAMLAFSIPAMADVDFDGNRHGDRWYEDRYDRYEDRLDERADLIEDYYDELEDAYEDGFFYYYDIDDFLDID